MDVGRSGKAERRMILRRRRKGRVEWALEHGFWEGFWACLGGSESETPALEWGSTSGLYDLNPISSIGYRYGVRECQRILAERNPRRFTIPSKPEIPGAAYAEAYGTARIAA